MQTTLLKALLQRLVDVEGQDFELFLFCLLDQNPDIDAQLVNELYLSLFTAGAGSMRDAADLRAIEHGFTGIDDLIAYGKKSPFIFEG